MLASNPRERRPKRATTGPKGLSTLRPWPLPRRSAGRLHRASAASRTCCMAAATFLLSERRASAWRALGNHLAAIMTILCLR
eukprot:4648949-Pyramimonas_sp.AAC.1